MKILAIETSCDETAISLLNISGNAHSPRVVILGNALFSQVAIHEQFGGVYPNVAKREHAKNLPILLKKVLHESGLEKKAKKSLISQRNKRKAEKILEREHGLYNNLIEYIDSIRKPHFDAIAVTQGPGLEPALWVGINTAKALAVLWDIPVFPINHMEGHIVSVLAKNTSKEKLLFPNISLLISGGHTELVHSPKLGAYSIIGKTRDDAVGEAYDKVARMLGLPYPGGPHIAKLAHSSRKKKLKNHWEFPRPMLHSNDLDFSFSGLKTSVLYSIKNKKLSKRDIECVAESFEDAVTEVLVTKVEKALLQYPSKMLIVGGGVASNMHIKQALMNIKEKHPRITILFPEQSLATDNSVMIGIAFYIRYRNRNLKTNKTFKASGNLGF